MTYFIEWLNNNSGAMASISGIITTAATIVLAVLTGIYVRLTRQILKSMNIPEIHVGIRWEKVEEKTNTYSVRIYVRNVGRSIAYNVKFSGDASFCPFGKRIFENADLLKDGILSLEPGHEKSSPVGSENIFSVLALRGIKKEAFQTNIRVTYEDLKGEEYCHNHPIDFSDAIGAKKIK